MFAKLKTEKLGASSAQSSPSPQFTSAKSSSVTSSVDASADERDSLRGDDGVEAVEGLTKRWHDSIGGDASATTVQLPFKRGLIRDNERCYHLSVGMSRIKVINGFRVN